MKNLELNMNNIKKTLTAAVMAGVILTTGNMTVKAESSKVSVQDVVNAMITGDKITAEITQEEADKLVIAAEKAIKQAGVNLLSDELVEQYDKVQTTKDDEKITNLTYTAIMCDKMLFDGSVKMMTYPEAIQFDNLCDEICGQLIQEGYKDIYSFEQSKKFGTEQRTELEEIMVQSEQYKQSKKGTYVVALGIDLGFYDDCFYDEDTYNPDTGLEMAPTLSGVALSGSALLTAALSKKKKEEKSKTYTKRK